MRRWVRGGPLLVCRAVLGAGTRSSRFVAPSAGRNGP